jgi:sodium transport system ATP-binding protein
MEKITGLLGSNGAGKTTTLRMICGVLQPDHGSVRVDRAIGALLDHIGLYARLTARENLVYFGELRGIPSTQLARRIDQVIQQLGMENIADRRTAGFSQGERMKTALARTILHSPQNLVLDEPGNGLDIPSVRALRASLRQMRDAGMCIVLSSHILEEIRILCDQVVIVAGGRVVAQGSPEDLCRETDSASLEDAFVQLTSRQEKLECSATH